MMDTLWLETYWREALAGLVVLGIGALFFSREAIIKRKLRNATAVKVNNFPLEGTGRLTGTVVGGRRFKLLLAPISRRPCVAWRMQVEEYRKSGKSSSWHTLFDEENSSNFYLEDGTGLALVKTAGVNMTLQKDDCCRCGAFFFDEAPPKLKRFLSKRGIKTKGWLFEKKLRYQEGVVELGERVVLCGERDASSKKGRLVIGGKLYLTDKVDDIT